MVLVLFLTLFLVVIGIFAYPKNKTKQIHESRIKAETEREAKIKKDMEKAETGKSEEIDTDGDDEYGSSDGDGE